MATEHLIFGPHFVTDQQRNEAAAAAEAAAKAPAGPQSAAEAKFDAKLDAIDKKAAAATVAAMNATLPKGK